MIALLLLACGDGDGSLLKDKAVVPEVDLSSCGTPLPGVGPMYSQEDAEKLCPNADRVTMNGPRADIFCLWWCAEVDGEVALYQVELESVDPTDTGWSGCYEVAATNANPDEADCSQSE